MWTRFDLGTSSVDSWFQTHLESMFRGVTNQETLRKPKLLKCDQSKSSLKGGCSICLQNQQSSMVQQKSPGHMKKNCNSSWKCPQWTIHPFCPNQSPYPPHRLLPDAPIGVAVDLAPGTGRGGAFGPWEGHSYASQMEWKRRVARSKSASKVTCV